jgi:hypothetical protein
LNYTFCQFIHSPAAILASATLLALFVTS